LQGALTNGRPDPKALALIKTALAGGMSDRKLHLRRRWRRSFVIPGRLRNDLYCVEWDVKL